VRFTCGRQVNTNSPSEAQGYCFCDPTRHNGRAAHGLAKGDIYGTLDNIDAQVASTLKWLPPAQGVFLLVWSTRATLHPSSVIEDRLVIGPRMRWFARTGEIAESCTPPEWGRFALISYDCRDSPANIRKNIGSAHCAFFQQDVEVLAHNDGVM
jgi:hypothetical protein